MTYVKAKAVGGGFADNAREQKSGEREIKVSEFLVAEIPEDVRAGAAFAMAEFGMNWKTGGTSRDQHRDGQTGFLEALAELFDRRESGQTFLFTFSGVGFVDVTVIRVQAGGLEAR